MSEIPAIDEYISAYRSLPSLNIKTIAGRKNAIPSAGEKILSDASMGPIGPGDTKMAPNDTAIDMKPNITSGDVAPTKTSARGQVRESADIFAADKLLDVFRTAETTKEIQMATTPNVHNHCAQASHKCAILLAWTDILITATS